MSILLRYNLTASVACKYGFGMHTADIKEEWILPYGKVRSLPFSLDPLLTPSCIGHIRHRRPRHRLFRHHQSRPAVLLPALRHLPALPHRRLAQHRVRRAHDYRVAVRQPVRLRAGVGRVGPAPRASVGLRHDPGVLLLLQREQRRDGHHAAGAADPDRAPAEPRVEGQAGTGGYVLDGVFVSPLCACVRVMRAGANKGRVTAVSAVALWKILNALGGEDIICLFPPR